MWGLRACFRRGAEQFHRDIFCSGLLFIFFKKKVPRGPKTVFPSLVYHANAWICCLKSQMAAMQSCRSFRATTAHGKARTWWCASDCAHTNWELKKSQINLAEYEKSTRLTGRHAPPRLYRRISVRRYGSAFVVKGLLSFINIGPCLLLVHIKYPYGSTEVLYFRKYDKGLTKITYKVDFDI